MKLYEIIVCLECLYGTGFQNGVFRLVCPKSVLWICAHDCVSEIWVRDSKILGTYDMNDIFDLTRMVHLMPGISFWNGSKSGKNHYNKIMEWKIVYNYEMVVNKTQLWTTQEDIALVQA